MAVDPFTLFVADAIVLAVMACAFLASLRRQPRAVHWRTFILCNIAFAASLFAFVMTVREASAATTAPLANVLVILGYGLNWRAVRQFSSRDAPWVLPVLFPCLGSAALFAVPTLVSYEMAYCAANIVALVQIVTIVWELWRDRRDGLVSRYGLVLSYCVTAIAFTLRSIQGLTTGYSLKSGVPADLLLQIHLLVTLVCTVSVDAFILSLAYERSSLELHHMALTDVLTGLPNRRAFEQQFRAKAERDAGRSRVLALFDIDHFKTINDRYGHAAGDEALRICAGSMSRSLSGSGFLARVGGEEFAVLLDDVSDGEARECLERVRRLIEAETVYADGHPIKLTVSAGSADASDRVDGFDRAMRKADENLYRAKRAGRNRIQMAA